MHCIYRQTGHVLSASIMKNTIQTVTSPVDPTCSWRAHLWKCGEGGLHLSQGQRLWVWWRNAPLSVRCVWIRIWSWRRCSHRPSAGWHACGRSCLTPPEHRQHRFSITNLYTLCTQHRLQQTLNSIWPNYCFETSIWMRQCIIYTHTCQFIWNTELKPCNKSHLCEGSLLLEAKEFIKTFMNFMNTNTKLTFCMSKPIARFSPRPSLSVALRSFCCRQISTSSSGLVTSNTYYNKEIRSIVENVFLRLWQQSSGSDAMRKKLTCGFWRKELMLLAQPPARLRSGSLWRRQEPCITASSQVLWMLR